MPPSKRPPPSYPISQRYFTVKLLASHGKDPVPVGSEIGFAVNLTVDIHGVDGRKGAHGIGYIVGAVSEGVANGGYNLAGGRVRRSVV